jgi:hypothetical protein
VFKELTSLKSLHGTITEDLFSSLCVEPCRNLVAPNKAEGVTIGGTSSMTGKETKLMDTIRREVDKQKVPNFTSSFILSPTDSHFVEKRLNVL